MWILGDWGQSQPWLRTSGVKMAKGTPFRLKVIKSTVDGTSGGVNAWSAASYSSVLNSHGAYDFGEFITNLIPNGSFEEGAVKWTPSDCIIERDYAHRGGRFLATGGSYPNIAMSDTFAIPPNQDLRYATYVRVSAANSLAIKDVNTHAVLFKASIRPRSADRWIAISETFKTEGLPVTAQVVCTNVDKSSFAFDDMSLIRP